MICNIFRLNCSPILTYGEVISKWGHCYLLRGGGVEVCAAVIENVVAGVEEFVAG